jgi:hypothetical protein
VQRISLKESSTKKTEKIDKTRYETSTEKSKESVRDKKVSL